MIEPNNFKELAKLLSVISLQASERILEIYHTKFDYKKKIDKSPLTLADLESNRIICSLLQKEFPKIPIISEENVKKEIYNHKSFFLIDPLDGTKEFINKNGEFTVNICYLYNMRPTVSVISIPASKIQYYTDGTASYKFEKGIAKKISSNVKYEKTRILVSRSHLDENTKKLIKNIKNSKIMKVGSSLKFCLIAEGKADLYIRYGKTMEWDTASGYAILENAGGETLDFRLKKMIYGKKDFLNTPFISYKENFNLKILKSILK